MSCPGNLLESHRTSKGISMAARAICLHLMPLHWLRGAHGCRIASHPSCLR